LEFPAPGFATIELVLGAKGSVRAARVLFLLVGGKE
jgi:hypothetical protein